MFQALPHWLAAKLNSTTKVFDSPLVGFCFSDDLDIVLVANNNSRNDAGSDARIDRRLSRYCLEIATKQLGDVKGPILSSLSHTKDRAAAAVAVAGRAEIVGIGIDLEPAGRPIIARTEQRILSRVLPNARSKISPLKTWVALESVFKSCPRGSILLPLQVRIKAFDPTSGEGEAIVPIAGVRSFFKIDSNNSYYLGLACSVSE